MNRMTTLRRPTDLWAYHYGHLSFPLRSGHAYPLPRYKWLRQQVLDSGLFYPERVYAGRAVGDDVLLLAHSADYLQKMETGALSGAELRQLNLPWSPMVVHRARHIVGATLAAGRSALVDGVSFVLGGGTHHAHRNFGSGFCIFNDIVCAARRIQQEGDAGQIAVLDCDVHQGDGTASLTAGDRSIFTCSVHGAANFPFEKAQSDCDIALPTGAGDEPYLDAVEQGLAATLASTPELLFYVAGADPFQEDRLGKLSVSGHGLAERDRLVIEACRDHNVPLVILLGGGYARPPRLTVDLNMQTIRLGCHIFTQ